MKPDEPGKLCGYYLDMKMMYDVCVIFMQGAKDKLQGFCGGWPSVHSQLLGSGLPCMGHICRCHMRALCL